MASLIPGFEYDIFISYRQKDNKYDGWVTEFVSNLKKEMEATFKEDVSVYFDINPHDGLLETHVVDASLREKLKCLIFIPVISQTYCDPKSFAWQHEFVAFNKIAKEDQFGRDIRLSGGNVGSRILPVKIHDLDPEDKELLENELGTVLRSVEFIYKSAGVNRPLRAIEDHPQDNLNKTYYRDQINKVANAIKEIINAIRKTDQHIIAGPKEITKAKTKPSKSLKTKILAGSLLLLVLIIAGYFFVPKLVASNNQVEKSIAVLPFINDSPDQENTYFINGLMDEILNNLQKIRDFRVLSRTSTEQFRGTANRTIPEIAKRLNVNYIVEGSGQKYGSTFRLRVQLIAAHNEKHLWGESFEQEIKETKDIFKIQSQVAQSIASALKATITPEEKQLIEKTPTANLTAYYYNQRGNEELYMLSDKNSGQSLKMAEGFYNKALECDSTYAEAYIGLAVVYLIKHRYESFYSEDYLDSVLILSDRALSFDDHLAEGYYYRGRYYYMNGKTEMALEEFDKALKYDPNFWEVYDWAGTLIYLSNYEKMDFVKGLEYALKAVDINRGDKLSELLEGLGNYYSTFAGFPEKGIYYAEEVLKLDGDTTEYLHSLAQIASMSRNYEKAIELFNRCYLRDSNNVRLTSDFAYACYMSDKPREALKYTKKIEGKLDKYLWLYFPANKRIGYLYWQNGYKKEAEKWFDKQKKLSEESLKLGRFYSVDANYDLAAVYAFQGEREKAYENLRKVAKIRVCPWWLLSSIKDDPLFKNIRNEPEFQQTVKELETKFQTEHERVRKWLEEQGKL